MASDFEVNKFVVGTDFLELRVPNEFGNKNEYVELTLWVNGQEFNSKQEKNIELLIGNRDSIGDIEHIEDEGEFDFSAYENVDELLEAMIERIVEESSDWVMNNCKLKE